VSAARLVQVFPNAVRVTDPLPPCGTWRAACHANGNIAPDADVSQVHRLAGQERSSERDHHLFGEDVQRGQEGERCADVPAIHMSDKRFPT
jgi:hypothetical protein